jgi:hypothetical protein
MGETMSKLEKMRAEAVQQVADRIVSVLRRQGVPEVAALEFVEERLKFLMMPGLKVIVEPIKEGAELRSRGSRDEHIVHFARLMHLHYPQLGGTPVPFGFEKPPEFEGVIEDRERLAAERAAVSDRMRRDLEDQSAHRQQAAQEAAAAALAAQAALIRNTF